MLKSAAAAGMAMVAGRGMASEADAARRGYSGPSFPQSNAPDHFCYDGCCIECGGDDIKKSRLHGRFVTCYTMKEFCEGHSDGCCKFCAIWAGGSSVDTCRVVP